MRDDRPFEEAPARDDPSARDTGQKSGSSKGGSKLARLRRQIQFMLKVWIPFLANPHERARLVNYSARDARVGLEWQIDWPAKCWKCGTTADIRRRQFSGEVRAFEKAIVILAVSVGIAIAIPLLACFLTISVRLLAAVLTLMVGAGLLIAKSWMEEVELAIWSCKEHASKLEKPQMTIDDEVLFILAPSSEIAEAAMVDLTERRRRKERAVDRKVSVSGKSESRSSGSLPGPTTSQPSLPAPTQTHDDSPIPFDDADHVVDVPSTPSGQPQKFYQDDEVIPFGDDDPGDQTPPPSTPPPSTPTPSTPPAAKPYSGPIPGSGGSGSGVASDSPLSSAELPPIPFDDDDAGPTQEDVQPEEKPAEQPRRSLIQPLPEALSDPSMHPPISKSEDQDEEDDKKKSGGDDAEDLLLG